MGIISILYIAASVCFLRGNAYSNDVILTGEIIDDNKTEVVKLKCRSSKEPAFHAVEFFVDHITADTVKLEKGKCYNSEGECNEQICRCSNAGNDFIWIFYPTDLLKKYVFGCQVRSFDEKNNIFKTTATLQFDGSDFLEQEQKDEYAVKKPEIDTNLKVNNNDRDNIPTIAGIISSVVFVLVLIIIALIAICYRKQSTESKTEENNEITENLKTKHKREMKDFRDYAFTIEKQLSAKDQEISELKKLLNCNESFLKGTKKKREDWRKEEGESSQRKDGELQFTIIQEV